MLLTIKGIMILSAMHFNFYRPEDLQTAFLTYDYLVLGHIEEGTMLL